MFYIILVPALLLLLYAIRSVHLLEKHDRVLYRFCQIRRDLMDILRRESETLSDADYAVGRGLLQFVNLTIGLYREHRASFFNWRDYIRFARQYRDSAEILQAFATSHEGLNKLLPRIGGATLLGFVAYTPFFRSEIVIRLIVHAAGFLAHHAHGAIARRLTRLKEFASFVYEQSVRFGGVQPAA